MEDDGRSGRSGEMYKRAMQCNATRVKSCARRCFLQCVAGGAHKCGTRFGCSGPVWPSGPVAGSELESYVATVMPSRQLHYTSTVEPMHIHCCPSDPPTMGCVDERWYGGWL